jgi:hypothetical protein
MSYVCKLILLHIYIIKCDWLCRIVPELLFLDEGLSTLGPREAAKEKWNHFEN